MRQFHERLEQRLSWYRKWHRDPTHRAMHYAFTFLFVLLMVAVVITFGHSHAAGNTYYVAVNGSDSNAGTQAAPWQTLAKVNSMTFVPGDSILFRRGDTFSGSIVPKSSGSSGAPITYGAYGSGANPIITGLADVSSWTNLGGNIWESTSPASILPTANVVAVGGMGVPVGRWPNSGWRTFSSSTASSITDSSLPTSPDWTGGEVVIRKDRWIIDRAPVTNQSGSTLSFTNPTSYNPKNGWGYFLQNSKSTLDSANEWYYDSSTKKLGIYSSGQPAAVQVSSVDDLVNIVNKKYLTFDSLSFIGANDADFYLGNAAYITIQNVSMSMSQNGVFGKNYGGSSPGFILKNSTVANINNNGIKLEPEFTGSYIGHNSFSNIAMTAGMGASGDGTYSAVIENADGGLVEYNQVNNTGYDGISFGGIGTKVENNLVSGYCSIKDDGGGIYTDYEDSGRVIANNIIVNGWGAPAGTSPAVSRAHGIYLDGSVSGNIQITGNSIFHGGFSSLFIHNAHDASITDNIDYDSDQGIFIKNDQSSVSTHNLSISNNISVGKTASQLVLDMESAHNDIPSFGIADNNYYVRPLADTSKIYVATSSSPNGTNYTLAGWQLLSGQDKDSKNSPVALSSANDIFFDYNASSSQKTDTLSAVYVDAKGVTYSTGSVTIPAWASVILFKTSGTVSGGGATPTPPPASPADTTPPAISLTAPAAGAALSGTVTVSANASDDVGVDHVDFYRGTTLIAGDSSSPYSVSLNTASLANGSYSLTAKAYDAAGNSAVSPAVSISISNVVVPPPDTAAPAVSIGSPAAGAALTGTATLTATASDNVGVSKVSFYQGTTLIDTDTTGSPYSISWDTTKVSNGTYSITAKASDAAGNTGTSSAVSVTVNNVAAVPPPTAGTTAWTFCANENATCTFSGTKQVRYGANGSYVYKNFTGSVACNNQHFGDPAYGILKSCYYGDVSTSAPAPTKTWTFCSKENATCRFSGTKQIRFGVNGAYNYKTFTKSVLCNIKNFGDPAVGLAKSCYY